MNTVVVRGWQVSRVECGQVVCEGQAVGPVAGRDWQVGLEEAEVCELAGEWWRARKDGKGC